MSSLLAAAFEHSTWATLRLLEACRELPATALEEPVPGAYGSILATLRHSISSDDFYLEVANGGATSHVSARDLNLDELTVYAETTGRGWRALLAEELDPDVVQREVDAADGYERSAPLGIRLAQALHHGNEHRAQCCLAMAALGYEPPDLSGWAFGAATGLVQEELAGAS